MASLNIILSFYRNNFGILNQNSFQAKQEFKWCKLEAANLDCKNMSNCEFIQVFAFDLFMPNE